MIEVSSKKVSLTFYGPITCHRYRSQHIGPISKSRVEWAWSPTAIIASHNNNNRKWREYNLQSYSWQIKSLGHLRDYYLNYFFLCQGHTKHGDVHLWSTTPGPLIGCFLSLLPRYYWINFQVFDGGVRLITHSTCIGSPYVSGRYSKLY